MERRLILDALTRTRGRRARAAEILGWGRSTLWRKMKQYGLAGGGE
jgi:DNA-binding NtrC family response regulator